MKQSEIARNPEPEKCTIDAGGISCAEKNKYTKKSILKSLPPFPNARGH